MSEMKKYMDVIRLGHKSTVEVLNDGDYILIQEKLDGANASFKREGNLVVAFSRNTKLSSENNLRGFYEWTQTLDANKLLEGVIYFGEWLVKHKIDYGTNANQFYLFDVYDEFTQEYTYFSFVRDEGKRLDLNIVPVFYEGKYDSFQHLESFIGKTELGVGGGEGIVVKNVNYQDKYGKQLFVKLVSDSFREVQKQKAPKDPNLKSAEQSAVESVLTKARVEKLIYKLIDENLLDEHFGIEDMGTILKQLGGRVYEDIAKEEYDVIKNYEEKDIRKAIGRTLPQSVKQIIKEKEAA
ncbi:RNA ligase family protein [Paenibacillus sp. FSL P4-0176]|uniref:RNA ligase family protein n=1 Tax=Paenibacillus sp. FSL P4-0176 TaxID=2921631 RepID=UPI0030CFC00B